MNVQTFSLCMIATSIFLFPFGDPSTALAKQVDDSAQAKQKQLFRMQIEREKSFAEARFQTRISDIHQACELSEAQQKTLAVASKGAVKSIISALKMQLVEAAKQSGFEFDPDKDQPKDLDTAENEMQFKVALIYGDISPIDRSQIESQKIWQSSLKSVLTAEQKEAFSKWTAEQVAVRRQTAVNNFVAKVDRSISLSAEQRKQLYEVVDSQYGDKLASQLAAETPHGINAVLNRNGQPPVAAEPNSRLIAEIMTPTQLQQWNESFRPVLESLPATSNPSTAALKALAVPAGEEDPQDEPDDAGK